MNKNIRFLVIIVILLSIGTKINAYEEYKIGDIISFKQSNWLVIEDSSESSDYVVLLKEKSLTK